MSQVNDEVITRLILDDIKRTEATIEKLERLIEAKQSEIEELRNYLNGGAAPEPRDMRSRCNGEECIL